MYLLIPRTGTVLSNIDISIYKIKGVDVDKNTDGGDLYAFQNPYDCEICSSDFTLGK